MNPKNCFDVKTLEQKFFINSVNSYHGKCLLQQLIAKKEGEEITKKKIKIVGTIDNISNAPPPEHAEIISFNNVSELFNKIKTCDVIVYDITETLEQVRQARDIIECLNNCHKDTACSLFVLVSTVGTWAMIECIDEEDVPITEEDFRSRKPHSNFIEQYQVERMAAKLGRIENLSSCVINCGLTYGVGENIFNFIFKAAWLNERHVPIYGCGKNVLPTIHVCDLARVISSVIHRKSRRMYILAVDNSKLTYREITEAITKRLSTKSIARHPYVDAFLNEDLKQMQIDLIGVHLPMASFLKETHNIELNYPDGLVENCDKIIESYRDCRCLPIPKIIILGPPCSGKSSISQHLSKLLNAPVFDGEDLRIDPVSEIVRKLSFCPDAKDEKDVPQQVETDEETTEILKLVEEIKAAKISGPEINDELFIKIVKRVTNAKLCRLHGFIFDGFPVSVEQASQLFQESVEASKTDQPPNKNEKPNCQFVFNLVPIGSFYVCSVLCLPEASFQNFKMTPESLYKKVSEYYSSSSNHKQVVDHLKKCSFKTTDIQISTIGPETLSEILQCLPTLSCDFIKPDDCCKLQTTCRPFNMAAIDEEDKFNEEQEMCSKKRTTTFHMIEEENYCLNQSSSMYYKYLSEKLLQRCAKGIIACYEEDPCDPVEFLAKYIFEGFECQEI